MTWCVLWVLLGASPAAADDQDTAAEVPAGTVDDPLPGGRERPMPGTKSNPLPGGRSLDLSGSMPGTVDDPLPGGRGEDRVVDDEEPEAAPQESAPEERPLAVPADRSVKVGVTRARGDEAEGWRADWQRVEQALLDLEDAVLGGLDRAVEELGLASGRGISVGVDEWRVDVEVLEADDQDASYRVRVNDDQGAPAEVSEAWVVSEDSGSEPRQLQVASGSEVVIEDLSVHESAAVQIHVGDGDIVMVWIDEAAPAERPGGR